MCATDLGSDRGPCRKRQFCPIASPLPYSVSAQNSRLTKIIGLPGSDMSLTCHSRVCVCVCGYVYVYAYVHVYMYMCMYMCMCAYVHMYMYMTYTYTLTEMDTG